MSDPRCKQVMIANGADRVPRTCPVHGINVCPVPDQQPEIPTADDIAAVVEMLKAANAECVKQYQCWKTGLWVNPDAHDLWHRIAACQRTLEWVVGGNEPMVFEDARELLGIHPGGL